MQLMYGLKNVAVSGLVEMLFVLDQLVIYIAKVTPNGILLHGVFILVVIRLLLGFHGVTIFWGVKFMLGVSCWNFNMKP